MQMHPAYALIRFGLGRRADQPLPPDARAWLLAQLEGPATGNYPDGLWDVPQAIDGLRALRERQKQTNHKIPPNEDPVAQAVKADVAAECANWIAAPDSFRERMVLFWTNHFTVSQYKDGEVSALVQPLIRDAIRPNVNGDFGTLLLAVMRHPAMLIYLNNAESYGPDSRLGLRSKKGLNENLGRECLELHTLSPAAGYTQTDVTTMAKILTGWSVKAKEPGVGFLFRPSAHEPGPKTLLGREFPEGEQGGVQALAFLAAHPATANHIALKLARHFVADDPPPALVARLAASYSSSNGHLPDVMRSLIDSPEAWPDQSTQPLTKLRTPLDFVCAAMRATNASPDQMTAVAPMMNQLGQRVWSAPSPKGWSDLGSDWVDPAELLQRVEVAYHIAALAGDQDPVQLADVALGPYASADVKHAVANAGSRREAITLLLSSPEFWRR